MLRRATRGNKKALTTSGLAADTLSLGRSIWSSSDLARGHLAWRLAPPLNVHRTCRNVNTVTEEVNRSLERISGVNLHSAVRHSRLCSGFMTSVSDAFTRHDRTCDRMRRILDVLEEFNQTKTVLPSKVREFLRRFELSNKESQ